MKDDRLPADLIPHTAVVACPTSFAAMSRTHFDTVTTRGE
jgi:NTE family protein